MAFYDRYAKICSEQGIEPCSQSTAERLKTTRSSISVWKKKGVTPMGESVRIIAEEFGITSDYLLGLSDDPFGNAAVKPPEHTQRLVSLLEQLDQTDRIKAEAYIEGMLAADKYAKK